MQSLKVVSRGTLVLSTVSCQWFSIALVFSEYFYAVKLVNGRSMQVRRAKLPIRLLDDTCCRYVRALEALGAQEEHEATKKATHDFLENDGPVIQEKLKTRAEDKDRYAYRTALALNYITCSWYSPFPS